jgi:hypothetical protein
MKFTQVARTILFIALGGALAAAGTAGDRHAMAIDADMAGAPDVYAGDGFGWATSPCEQDVPPLPMSHLPPLPPETMADLPPTPMEDVAVAADHFDTGPVCEQQDVVLDEPWYGECTDSPSDDEDGYRYEYPTDDWDCYGQPDETENAEEYYYKYGYGYGYEYACPEDQHGSTTDDEAAVEEPEVAEDALADDSWYTCDDDCETDTTCDSDQEHGYDFEDEYWAEQYGCDFEGRNHEAVIDVEEDPALDTGDFEDGCDEEYTDSDYGYEYYDYEDEYSYEPCEVIEEDTAAEPADDQWQPEYTEYE